MSPLGQNRKSPPALVTSASPPITDIRHPRSSGPTSATRGCAYGGVSGVTTQTMLARRQALMDDLARHGIEGDLGAGQIGILAFAKDKSTASDSLPIFGGRVVDSAFRLW